MAQMVHVELGRMGFPAAEHAMLCKHFGGHEHASDLTAQEVDVVLAEAEGIAAETRGWTGTKWRDRCGLSRLQWRVRRAIQEHGMGWVATICRRICDWEPAGLWEIQEHCSAEELHNIVAAIERTDGWPEK